MIMRKHQREIADYLRDEYGAGYVRMEPGGKHPRLVFNYQNEEHKVLIGNPSDFRAVRNLQSAIRKKLGEPIMDEDKQPRKLEDMMTELHSGTATMPQTLPQEPIPSATKDWSVKVASYRNGKNSESHTVWFLFPKNIMQSFPGNMKIEKIDDEHWRLFPGGSSPFHEYSNQAKITYSDQNVPTFGATVGEAVEEGDGILVFLAKDKRNGVNTPVPFKSAVGDIEKFPKASLPPPTPAPTTPIAPPSIGFGVAMEVRMRSIINGAREIEALCPYRLKRMPDGRLVWQAPVIE